jgi:hypothetical protein
MEDFMKTLLLLLSFLVVSTAFAQESNEKKIKLGTYYFAGWAGKNAKDDGTPENAWAKGMPGNATKKLVTEYSDRMPPWGWRDDAPGMMEHQIDLAADHGISFFSFCWYWFDNRGSINKEAINTSRLHLAMQRFMKAENNHRMEFSILVANHGGFEIIGTQAWKDAADCWIELFKHPRYLKVNGKPLVTIFSPQTVDAEGVAYLQQAAQKAGFPGVDLACCGKGDPNIFSFRTRYNVIPGYGKPDEEHPYSELVLAHAKEWYGTPQQPCIPEATVSWDARARGTKSWYYTDSTPEAFDIFLTWMVQWMDEHPEQVNQDRLAVVCAWNELDEGSILVPTQRDPDGKYLKVIKRIVYGK